MRDQRRRLPRDAHRHHPRFRPQNYRTKGGVTRIAVVDDPAMVKSAPVRTLDLWCEPEVVFLGVDDIGIRIYLYPFHRA